MIDHVRGGVAMKLPQTGGCQCGKIRYEITDAPQSVYACHCRDCQRLTSSAFSMGAVVAEAAFKLSGVEPRSLQRLADSGGCNPIPLFRARVSLREDFILKVWAIWRYLLIAWGHWAAAPRPRVGEGAALASGCGHAAAGAVSAAAAAMRRRSVSAQDRLSASACITQTARTFSRPCTRNRVMPRFLMMPCARSVSLRRR